MDTVIPIDADWNEDFQEWLAPFLAVFKRCAKIEPELTSNLNGRSGSLTIVLGFWHA